MCMGLSIDGTFPLLSLDKILLLVHLYGAIVVKELLHNSQDFLAVLATCFSIYGFVDHYNLLYDRNADEDTMAAIATWLGVCYMAYHIIVIRPWLIIFLALSMMIASNFRASIGWWPNHPVLYRIRDMEDAIVVGYCVFRIVFVVCVYICFSTLVKW
jgi:hypothetical protein